MIRRVAAGILPVGGDPLNDVTVLQNTDSFRAIMKDGDFRKAPGTARELGIQPAERRGGLRPQRRAFARLLLRF